MQRIFGGQVAGQALMAAASTLPEGRGVHSLHSYFLRPGDPNEEIRYAVERMRDGRTFSTRRVVAWQRRGEKDVAIFALTADASAGEAAVRRARAADARRAGAGEPAHVPRAAGRARRRGAGGDEHRHGGGAADARAPLRPPAEDLPGHEVLDVDAGGRAAARRPGGARRGADLRQRPEPARRRDGADGRRLGEDGGLEPGPRGVVPPAAAGRRVVPLRDRQPGGVPRPGAVLRPDLGRSTAPTSPP